MEGKSHNLEVRDSTNIKISITNTGLWIVYRQYCNLCYKLRWMIYFYLACVHNEMIFSVFYVIYIFKFFFNLDILNH